MLTFDDTFRRGEFLGIIRGHAGTGGCVVDDGRRRALSHFRRVCHSITVAQKGRGGRWKKETPSRGRAVFPFALGYNTYQTRRRRSGLSLYSAAHQGPWDTLGSSEKQHPPPPPPPPPPPMIPSFLPPLSRPRSSLPPLLLTLLSEFRDLSSLSCAGYENTLASAECCFN